MSHPANDQVAEEIEEFVYECFANRYSKEQIIAMSKYCFEHLDDSTTTLEQLPALINEYQKNTEQKDTEIKPTKQSHSPLV